MYQEQLERRILLAGEIQSVSAADLTAGTGEQIAVPVLYDTLDNTGQPQRLLASGLGLRLHFDSTKLTFDSLSIGVSEDAFFNPNTVAPQTETANEDDGDPSTDMFITAAWNDLIQVDGGWPASEPTFPVTLYTANFTTAANFSSETNLNFTDSSNGTDPTTGLSFEFASDSATIRPEAPPPELAIAATDATKAEGDSGTTDFTFTVTRSGDTTGTSSVDYAVTGSGSDPADAADFSGVLPSGTIAFAAGETSRVITVGVSGDTDVEADEGFTVTLSNPVDATITTGASDGTIGNDDTPGAVGFQSVSADDQSVAVATTFSVPVNYETLDGASNPVRLLASGLGLRLHFDSTKLTFDSLTIGVSEDAFFNPNTVAPQTETANEDDGDPSTDMFITAAWNDLIQADGGWPASEPTFPVTLYTANFTTAANFSSETNLNFTDSSNGTDPTTGLSFEFASDSATIRPEAPPPELSIAATDATKAEGDSGTTDFTFTVTRSGDTSGTSSVDYAVTGSGSDPADAADFSGVLPSGTIAFAAGETSRVITVGVSGDTDVEADEGFTVTLSNPVDATITTGASDGTIGNDDTPGAVGFQSVSADDQSVAVATTFSVPVNYETLDGASNPVRLLASGLGLRLHFDSTKLTFDSLTIGVSEDAFFNPNTVAPQTETANEDDGDPSTDMFITAAWNDLIQADGGWPASEPTFPVTLYTANFTTAANFSSETNLNFTDSSNGTDPTTGLSFEFASDSATIRPEAPPPELSIAATDATKAEGDSGTTDFTFTVTRSGDTTGTSSVDYAVTGSGSDPADAADFSGVLPSGTIAFAAGETSRVITVGVSGDTDVEADEGFTVTLSNPVDATITTGTSDGTIGNDDTPGAVGFQSVSADDQSVAVATSFSVPVNYETLDGASNPVRLLASGLGLRLHFDSTKLTFDSLTIGVSEDAFFNPNTVAPQTETANEDDGDPSTDMFITAAWNDLIQADGGWPASEPTFPVTLYTANFTTAANFSSETNLNFTNSSNGTDPTSGLSFEFVSDSATIRPQANLPEISIDAAVREQAEGDSGTTDFTFTVTRSGDTSGTSSVDYAVTGSGSDPADAADFSGVLPSGTIAFAAGETSRVITVGVSGDTDVEADEGFTVTLSNPVDATLDPPSSVDYRILDDDAVSAATLLFTVTSPADNPVTPEIEVAALSDVDVTISVVSASSSLSGFQLNFGNSEVAADELALLDWVINSAFDTPVDSALATPGDTFVAGGTTNAVDAPVDMGTFTLRTPAVATPTDYLLTVNRVLGDELNDTILSNALGESITIADFGDEIIRVVADPPTVESILINSVRNNPADLPKGQQPTTWERQRSTITDLVVTFSKPVNPVRAADVVLTNLGVDAPVDADQVVTLSDSQFALSDGDTKLTISFPPNTLADGAYQLDILPTVTDKAGVPLDGDNDGNSGGANQFKADANNRFWVLTADWNGSRGVNIQDFATFAYWFQNAVPPAPEYVDLNNSGGINIQDFAGFANNFLSSITLPAMDTGTPTAPSDELGTGVSIGELQPAVGTVNEFDLIPDPADGTVVEEAGTTVIEVLPGAEIDFSVVIASATELVNGYQLNFGNSDALLDLSNWVNNSTNFLLPADPDISGDRFVSAGRIGGIESPPPAEMGTLLVTAPATPGDYLLTVDFVTGNELLDTIISDLTGAALAVTDFGDAIIRVLDNSPKVSIAADDAVKTEGDTGLTTFTFAVTRSGDTSAAASVQFDVTGSGANPADANDFGGAFPSGTVDFAAGETTKSITVSVSGDLDVEADEGFTVTLSSPVATAIVTAEAQGIIENDDAAISIAASDAVKREGDAGATAFEFTVTRVGAVGRPAEVQYDVAGVGAAPADGSDFGGAFPSGTVTFAAGETSKTLVVDVSGDTDVELDEGFGVRLSDATGATIDVGIAEGLIQNDDTSVSIRDEDAFQSEGDSGTKQFTFTVVREGISTGVSTVDFAVTGSGSDPADAADFGGALPSGTVSFAAGETIQSITVNVSGDLAVESDEGFSVTLSNPTGTTIEIARADGLILNDDAALEIVADNATQNEGDADTTPFTFVVSRRGDSTGAASANYAVIGSGANPADADDFGGALPSGTVSFADGETVQTITINVSGDIDVESDEGFTVTLSSSVGAVLSSASADGLIQNDDSLASIAATDAVKAEGDVGLTAFTFTVTREGDVRNAADIDFSVAGSGASPADAADFDGALPSGSVRFESGETTKVITIDVSGDTDVESDESFLVSLSNPRGVRLGTSEATGVIENDDSSISIIARDASKEEGDTGNTEFTFTVSRIGDTSGLAQVAFAVTGTGVAPADGADFGGVLPSGVVDFAAGETSKTLTLLVSGDSDVEPDEEFVVTISDPVGATISVPTANGLIVNDDAAISIIASSAEKEEGDSGVNLFTFTVSRRGAIDRAASAEYTVAGSGSDPADADDFGGVLPTGVVTFSAGEVVKTISIPVSGDTQVEPDETFSVTLSNPVGSTLEGASAVGIIRDDDELLPTLSIVPANAFLSEGDSGTTDFTFTVIRSGDTSFQSTANFIVAGSGTNPANADDFGGSFPTGTVTFAPGESIQTITVGVSGDVLLETDESFTVSLFGSSRARIAIDSAPGVILNDDDALLVASTDAVKDEGDSGSTEFRFTVVRMGDTTRAARADYLVSGSGDTPADADDFGGAFPVGSVSFAPGEVVQTIVVNVSGDTIVEPDEGFELTLLNPVDTTIDLATAPGIIRNDDSSLAIEATDAIKREGDVGSTLFQFTVTRVGDLTGTTSVDFNVAGSGADPANEDDFGGAFASGTIVFLAGETEKVIDIAVSGDTDVEADEGFTVTLTNPVDATLSLSSAEGLILNDDASLSIVATDAIKPEGDVGTTPFTFTVTRDGDTSGPISVVYDVTGSGADPADANDFGGALPSGTVSFAAGETTQTIVIGVSGDLDVEADEEFTVSLSSVLGGTITQATASGTILNDDASISIAAVDAIKPEGDSGTTPFVFELLRVGDISGTATVDFAVGGSGLNPADADDFGGALPSGTVSFAAGETTQTLIVGVSGDTLVEFDEGFTVRLLASVDATLGTASADGLIINDDSYKQFVDGGDKIISPGDSFSIPVTYETLDGSGNPETRLATGLGLRLHFDSSRLTFNGLGFGVIEDVSFVGFVQDDSSDFDNDALTDKFVTVLWDDEALNDGGWPSRTALPATLFNAAFTSATDFVGSSKVNFSASNVGIDTVTNQPFEFLSDFGLISTDQPEVIDHHIFYNRSFFDGTVGLNDGADDDAAIDHSKSALLPGETADHSNFTGYAKGINGIMLDVFNLAGVPTVDDFEFRVGNTDSPSQWDLAPSPDSVSFIEGGGPSGFDRIVITWADNAIEKQWLQVSLLPTANTGLAQADVHYWGNAVGDTMNDSGSAFVNTSDVTRIRLNPRNFLNPAQIDDVFDVNKDRFVNTSDVTVARLNGTNFLNALTMFSAPDPPALPSVNDSDVTSQIVFVGADELPVDGSYFSSLQPSTSSAIAPPPELEETTESVNSSAVAGEIVRSTSLSETVDPAAAPIEDVGSQLVSSVDQTVVSGVQFALPVYYQTVDSSGAPSNRLATGLGLRLHFDSTKLEFDGLSDVLGEAIYFDPAIAVAQEDSANDDFEAATDKVITAAWNDFLQLGGGWPSDSSQPTLLYNALFTPSTDLVDSTAINFTATSRGSDVGTNESFQFQSNSATVSVKDASVVGRHIFYNRSYFDGSVGSLDGGSDSAAIDPSKTPLLPGDVASTSNYTGYTRGINGIIIDVDGLADLPTIEDFEFRVGNSQNPEQWELAPAPNSIQTQVGEGESGSDRIFITWDDDAIANQWLEVKVLPTTRTGLSSADVHYWGNTTGDTQNDSGDSYVNTGDVTRVRLNLGYSDVNTPEDVNKDGVVDEVDVQNLRESLTNFRTALQMVDLSASQPVSGPAPSDATIDVLPPPKKNSDSVTFSPHIGSGLELESGSAEQQATGMTDEERSEVGDHERLVDDALMELLSNHLA